MHTYTPQLTGKRVRFAEAEITPSLPRNAANVTRGVGRRLQALLTCAVCDSVFTEPCTLGCGHTFCKACVTGGLDGAADT